MRKNLLKQNYIIARFLALVETQTFLIFCNFNTNQTKLVNKLRIEFSTLKFSILPGKVCTVILKNKALLSNLNNLCRGGTFLVSGTQIEDLNILIRFLKKENFVILGGFLKDIGLVSVDFLIRQNIYSYRNTIIQLLFLLQKPLLN